MQIRAEPPSFGQSGPPYNPSEHSCTTYLPLHRACLLKTKHPTVETTPSSACNHRPNPTLPSCRVPLSRDAFYWWSSLACRVKWKHREFEGEKIKKRIGEGYGVIRPIERKTKGWGKRKEKKRGRKRKEKGKRKDKKEKETKRKSKKIKIKKKKEKKKKSCG